MKVQQRDADAFKCDGRTYCSQMTPCAEATFFIRNCPDRRWTATGMVFRVNASGAMASRNCAMRRDA